MISALEKITTFTTPGILGYRGNGAAAVLIRHKEFWREIRPQAAARHSATPKDRHRPTSCSPGPVPVTEIDSCRQCMTSTTSNLFEVNEALRAVVMRFNAGVRC